MNLFRNIVSSLLLALVFVLPVVVSAQTNLPTGTQVGSGTVYGITYECNNGGVPGECTFADLWAAIQHLMNWATGFALAFSFVVIAWAGFNYLISGDNPSKRTKANQSLTKVLIGIFFIVAAWGIVRLITAALVVNTGISTLG